VSTAGQAPGGARKDRDVSKDPKKWVETGQRVEAHYAIGDEVAATGKVISYCDAPTVTIETDDGRRVSWRVDLTEAVQRTAEDGAAYVFRSNLRSDGAAFLSLHRVGEDVHLRVRHITSAPLTYEVAVLSPYERRALITALSQFDDEPPARTSVRVENHGGGEDPNCKPDTDSIRLLCRAAIEAAKRGDYDRADRFEMAAEDHLRDDCRADEECTADRDARKALGEYGVTF
jgi:hypothetical protein